MSIRIDADACIGCGRCTEACPGNLLDLAPRTGAPGRVARIARPRDCWGCTSCLKECPAGAISFFLGADMGGRGGTLTASFEGSVCHWRIKKPTGDVVQIDVDGRDSNKY